MTKRTKKLLTAVLLVTLLYTGCAPQAGNPLPLPTTAPESIAATEIKTMIEPAATPAAKIAPKPVAVTDIKTLPEPVAVTSKPVAVTPKPVAVTPKPVTVTPVPVAVTPVPEAVTPKPAVTTPVPAAQVQERIPCRACGVDLAVMTSAELVAHLASHQPQSVPAPEPLPAIPATPVPEPTPPAVVIPPAGPKKVAREITVCNTCGADITGNPIPHIEEHLLKLEGGSYHTEVVFD